MVMRWKALLVAALLLGGVGAAMGFYWPFGRAPEVLEIPGIVEVHEVRLGPRVGGRVAEVLVGESDEVKAGQPLVRLETPELQAQRKVLQARVAEAKADLDRALNGARQEEKDAARAAMEAADARLKRLEKGSREEEKKQAQSDYEASLADEQLAAEEFQRLLRMPRAATPAEKDVARANLERARRRLASARARHEMHVIGARPEDILEARAELRRFTAQWELLENGTRPEDRASAKARLGEAVGKLEELDVQIAEAVVRAAEPVVVELVTVRKGDLVQAGQPVVRVLRQADLWVKTYVPETELGKLRLGQDVQVSMDAYPRRRFAGKVVHIGSESEFTPRNVQTLDERRHQMFGVRVRIADPQGLFKSGMAAQVYVPVER
jgi:multidrug resistance efflux pump